MYLSLVLGDGNLTSPGGGVIPVTSSWSRLPASVAVAAVGSYFMSGNEGRLPLTFAVAGPAGPDSRVSCVRGDTVGQRCQATKAGDSDRQVTPAVRTATVTRRRRRDRPLSLPGRAAPAGGNIRHRIVMPCVTGDRDDRSGLTRLMHGSCRRCMVLSPDWGFGGCEAERPSMKADTAIRGAPSSWLALVVSVIVSIIELCIALMAILSPSFQQCVQSGHCCRRTSPVQQTKRIAYAPTVVASILPAQSVSKTWLSLFRNLHLFLRENGQEKLCPLFYNIFCDKKNTDIKSMMGANSKCRCSKEKLQMNIANAKGADISDNFIVIKMLSL